MGTTQSPNNTDSGNNDNQSTDTPSSTSSREFAPNYITPSSTSNYTCKSYLIDEKIAWVHPLYKYLNINDYKEFEDKICNAIGDTPCSDMVEIAKSRKGVFQDYDSLENVQWVDACLYSNATGALKQDNSAGAITTSFAVALSTVVA